MNDHDAFLRDLPAIATGTWIDAQTARGVPLEDLVRRVEHEVYGRARLTREALEPHSTALRRDRLIRAVQKADEPTHAPAPRRI